MQYLIKATSIIFMLALAVSSQTKTESASNETPAAAVPSESRYVSKKNAVEMTTRVFVEQSF